jgi:exosortase D (VPLPA-CTERM-specific)
MSGLVLALAALAALVVMFDDNVLRMLTTDWQYPEYQHAFIVPLVSLYLVWMRAIDLKDVEFRPSWLGAVLVLIGAVVFMLGDLSAIWIIGHFALVLTLWGLVLAIYGLRAVSVIWAGLFGLVFMIPLPSTVQQALSGSFQLLSSQIGTGMLRAVGVSVYLEGNVIDLGSYKLQVVEACSGLRYLFPLTSFSFFCAYLFRGALWQRIVIFLSAVPITILMNSVRIAVTGVLVNRFGISQAEGFLHYFEGWVIFVACIALLFFEMALFAKFSRRPLAEAFQVEIPAWSDFRYLVPGRVVHAPLVAAVVMLGAGGIASVMLQGREEIIPRHVPLNAFPLVVGDWRGSEGSLTEDVLDELKLTEYLISSYRRPDTPVPVELYVAYYDSQRKGSSVHSPRACLPGGGWHIDQLDVYSVPEGRGNGEALPVNRAVIAQGPYRALVYYWFMQRGRYLTNEYAVKWYIFWDSLTRRRSDGATVRVMMPIDEATDVETASQQLDQFIRSIEPKLYYHIPQETVVAADGNGQGTVPL